MPKTTLLLDVPLVAQSKSDTCWHASSLMIWRYWQGISGRMGPMHSLSDNWRDNRPLTSVQEIIQLAQNVGLRKLPVQNTFSSSDLVSMLEKHGPIWSAGIWYGPGHAVVLTGADGGTVHINDPDGGVKKKETVSWFNKKLLGQIPGCLMCKDPDAY